MNLRHGANYIGLSTVDRDFKKPKSSLGCHHRVSLPMRFDFLKKAKIVMWHSNCVKITSRLKCCKNPNDMFAMFFYFFFRSFVSCINVETTMEFVLKSSSVD